MSAVPQELRDEVVRRLERAIDERDHQLEAAHQETRSLRQALGALEGDMARQSAAFHQIEREQRRLGEELERERRQALARLESLRARSEEQHRQLEGALREAERRHRQEWQALNDRIEQLAQTRQQKENRTRDAGRRALARAESVLRDLERAALEAMDLSGELAAGEALLADGRAVAAHPDAAAAEVLSAGQGAAESASGVAARLEHRRTSIAELARELAAEADWLTAFLAGDAMLDLPDQRAELDLLLVPERRLMQSLVDSQVRVPAAALKRWNGHAAQAARLAGARDLLGAEILRARKALPGAKEHEERRYKLDHVLDDLELRFARIEDESSGTLGVWAVPEDHKSTYIYMLKSHRGEVVVEVPWSGTIAVRHEGRLLATYPLIEEAGPDAILISGLAGRWHRLGERLANPQWDPDIAPEGGHG